MEAEAWALRNADHQTRCSRLGYVRGLPEAGVIARYWSRRTAAGVAESLEYGISPKRVLRRLRRV